MPTVERTPYERETLVYQTPEQAQALHEKVGAEIVRRSGGKVSAPREAIGEIVANEIAQHGYGVTQLSQPWEHSGQEHEEAQQLVDLAFAKDLPTALAKARASSHYPRNLDLFHDVLTNELYTELVTHKLNRQPLAGWSLLLLVIVLVITIAGLLLWLTAF